MYRTENQNMNALEREAAYRQVARHIVKLNAKLGIGQLPKELYTKEEAAQILSVSARTIEELIANGRLGSVLLKTEPHVTRGIRRITRAQIEAYIAKLEVEAKFKR
jgi:excisionase family DNA binding protein